MGFTGVDQEFSKRGPSQGIWGTLPQWRSGANKLKQSEKLVYTIQRFSVQYLVFNEYRSRAWTLLLCTNTQLKNLKIHWGFEPPNLLPAGYTSANPLGSLVSLCSLVLRRRRQTQFATFVRISEQFSAIKSLPTSIERVRCVAKDSDGRSSSISLNGPAPVAPERI